MSNKDSSANKMNPTNILKEKWDFLIILDACRYDYFERVHRDYLGGNLTKRVSVGSSTLEWRDKTFTDYYDDIVYISANPRIASDIRVRGFLGNEHFHKVYDIWKHRWDKTRGTVLPDAVTAAAIDIIRESRDKRIIVHYLQPHAPYLVFGSDCKGFADPNADMGKFLKGIDAQNRKAVLRSKLLRRLLRIFKPHGLLGDHPEWMLRQMLWLPPKTPMDAIRRKYGRAGLKAAYEENLKTVLQQVSILLEHLWGKIVITADHGELLGENRCYTHIDGSSNSLLLQIPWLVINKESGDGIAGGSDSARRVSAEADTSGNEQQKPEDSKELAEKLRALGYYE